MTTSHSAPQHAAVDLTAPPPLADGARLLRRLESAAADEEAIRAAADDEQPRERKRRRVELFRELEPEAAIELLKVAAGLALQGEAAGVRLLLGFLEVKRPGVEVLDELRGLTGLRRFSLKLAVESWEEGEVPPPVPTTNPLLEVAAEGARLGALDPEIAERTHGPADLRGVHQHLCDWFDRIARQLRNGCEVSEKEIEFITQLALLEVVLLEKRLSLVARSIDPHDTRHIARLLPVMSRYDQEIEHMKDVVSRISTYEPFLERLLTMERVMTSSGMEKLLELLSRDVAARGLGRVIEAMRLRPVLEREFAYQISQLYQIALLRVGTLDQAEPPDLLSIMLQVLEFRQEDTSLTLVVEPDVADAIWPSIARWDVSRPSRDLIEIRFREEHSNTFILPDGTPRLPEDPEERPFRELSLSELVLSQIANDSFILGILENSKATAMPGLVGLIARQSRSLRVLDKIIRLRQLHTGVANSDVPRLLLMNPSHIPISSLKRFIHVRFVSRADLRRMARRSPDMRPEISREIAAYLRNLR
jgi:hypothetical protein